MGKTFNFWWICVKRAVRGSSPFANDWQWLFGIPFWQWAGSTSTFVGLAAYFMSSGQSSMSTGSAALDGIVVATAAFIATWFVAVILHIFSSASNLYHEEKQRADAAEARISELFDEYAHSLYLEQIDQEDRREFDKETKKILIGRKLRCPIRLRNVYQRPIRYAVTALKINDIEQVGHRTNGGIIAANSSATYYSHFIDAPIDNVHNAYNWIMTLNMDYGHPDMPATRTVVKRMILELIPSHQSLNMLYQIDTDKPKPLDQNVTRQISQP